MAHDNLTPCPPCDNQPCHYAVTVGTDSGGSAAMTSRSVVQPGGAHLVGAPALLHSGDRAAAEQAAQAEVRRLSALGHLPRTAGFSVDAAPASGAVSVPGC